MLARLPLPCLLLMAAFATFILCLYVDRTFKVRKLTATFFVLSVAGCFGMIVVGGLQYHPWSPEQMLVEYSFTWTGMTIGLLWPRKRFLEYCDEWRRGIRRETYEYSKWWVAGAVTSVSLMSILGFILAT
ncbi:MULTISPECIES: hypothetical protein [Streptomyces]|uniref:Integron gene cassette protein n=1 Tax=Streptomyces caniferus TaxID=285557 RepID=A0ABZ1VXJ2_9ACTN|nr:MULTISPECIES: hypothetical protein [Streptomyces]WUB84292.1 hypothetical protein OG424_36930 [Streptomyces platensis]